MEPANSITSPLPTLNTAKIAANHVRIGTSCAPDELGRRLVTGREEFFWVTAGTARILLLASRTGPAKQPPPDVLACCWRVRVRIPKTRYDRRSFLFEDIRLGFSKGRKPHRFGGVRQGSSGLPDDLDPVRDCRRLRRNVKFLQRLNRMACIDG